MRTGSLESSRRHGKTMDGIPGAIKGDLRAFENPFPIPVDHEGDSQHVRLLAEFHLAFRR